MNAKQKNTGVQRKSEGRSSLSKYSPANISLWLRAWKNDRENWQFKSIAQDEAIRICLNRELMAKDDFELFCEFMRTCRSGGAYKRLVGFCEETEEAFNADKTDEETRNRMKRVVKLRAVLEVIAKQCKQK